MQGGVAATDAKIKAIDGNKYRCRPSGSPVVSARREMPRLTLDSKEIDSVLVVQDKTGKQLAWDDDSGGGLNSLLTIDILQDGTYQVFAASIKGTGHFHLKVRAGQGGESTRGRHGAEPDRRAG